MSSPWAYLLSLLLSEDQSGSRYHIMGDKAYPPPPPSLHPNPNNPITLILTLALALNLSPIFNPYFVFSHCLAGEQPKENIRYRCPLASKVELSCLCLGLGLWLGLRSVLLCCVVPCRAVSSLVSSFVAILCLAGCPLV